MHRCVYVRLVARCHGRHHGNGYLSSHRHAYARPAEGARAVRVCVWACIAPGFVLAGRKRAVAWVKGARGRAGRLRIGLISDIGMPRISEPIVPGCRHHTQQQYATGNKPASRSSTGRRCTEPARTMRTMENAHTGIACAYRVPWPASSDTVHVQHLRCELIHTLPAAH